MLLIVCSPLALVHAEDNLHSFALSSCQNLIQAGSPIDPASQAPAGDAISGLIREPYKNVRAQQGTRFTGMHNDGTEFVWTSIETDAQIQAVQVTTSRDQQPRKLWQFDAQCQLTQHRELIYGDSPRATALRVLNPDDGTVLLVEPLNPPVPDISTNTTDPSTRIRVGIVDSGVNYNLPEINERLARDPQGKLIGYDFWEDDELPFDSHFGQSAFHVIRHGTGTASLLLKESPRAELVPYRYPRPDMTRMQALVEHAAANQVRVLGLPLGGNKEDQWQAFAKAAAQHPDILFIASAGNNGRNIDQQPVYPAALDLQNLLVVTSADDFVVPAERVNWGRTHVDYMLPAENQSITNFAGQATQASGSSYAVPRAMSIAVKWLANNPEWGAPELIAEFARRYADGRSVRHVGGGYIADPLADDELAVELVGVQTLAREIDTTDDDGRSFKLPLSVFVLHDEWTNEEVNQSLLKAESVLKQCDMSLNSVTITRLSVPEYLRDLATGPAKTLTSALQHDSEFKPVKVFYARDTRMARPTDGASFGRGNTRQRPWLQDSVWLMDNIEDPGIALAHELFHVLSNNGGHSRMVNNLMQARTSQDNTKLLESQCTEAIDNAKQHRLLFD